MPSPRKDDEPEINLLSALQTAFSKDADPEMFLAQAQDEIQQVERVIIETCSKNRIRIDDNLYALLESRDAISEQVQDINNATASASEITKDVNKAVAVLTEKMQIRQNLDASLNVAAQTRKLARMYARIEDTIDSRRLYTAFRMLKVLEEETRCVKPGTILQELVPDTHRLRSKITLHARKSFHSWLTSVRKSEAELGAYALHHVNKQASGHQNLVNASRLGSLNDTYSLLHSITSSKTQPEGSKDNNRSNRSRPWTPVLTPQAPPTATLLPRSHPPRSYSSQRIGVMSPVKASLPPEGNFRPEIGGDARAGMRSFASEYKGDVPVLHLRPLLQSVIVNDGLELLGDLRADYRRERLAGLKKMLDDALGVGDEAGPAEREPSLQMGTGRARQIESFVCRVCGFFVVERAVEMHATPTILPRAVVDNEWWTLACARIQTLLKEQDEPGLLGPTDKAWARSLQGSLEKFAKAYDFVL